MIRVHLCTFSRNCRRWKAPPRLHVSTRRWHFMLALTPDGKALRHGEWRWWDFHRSVDA